MLQTLRAVQLKLRPATALRVGGAAAWRAVGLIGIATLSCATPILAQDDPIPPAPNAALMNLADGPYVDALRSARWRARLVDRHGNVREIAVASGRVAVPGVAGLPAFQVPLRPKPSIAKSVETLRPRNPLLVVADTHGEYPILVALLRSQGVVGADLRWTFGRGHLVVTGDMFDRGAHQIEILWLLYKLEAEARARGGRVHVLFGNHEALALRGDERYLNAKYRAVAKRLDAASYSTLLGPQSVLGAWIRSRPAVLKLGELLVLHGGISPELTASTLTLDMINTLARDSLDMPHKHKFASGTVNALLTGSSGPLWYRGYFPRGDKPAAATAQDVDASLRRFDVSRILVGHTIVDEVTPLYDGKVIAVQVYPRWDKDTNKPVLEGALRVDGVWYRATAQAGRVPLLLD